MAGFRDPGGQQAGARRRGLRGPDLLGRSQVRRTGPGDHLRKRRLCRSADARRRRDGRGCDGKRAHGAQCPPGPASPRCPGRAARAALARSARRSGHDPAGFLRAQRTPAGAGGQSLRQSPQRRRRFGAPARFAHLGHPAADVFHLRRGQPGLGQRLGRAGLGQPQRGHGRPGGSGPARGRPGQGRLGRRGLSLFRGHGPATPGVAL